MRKYILVGALALGLLAACGDDDTERTESPATQPATTPSSAAVAAANLEGMSFTATEITVDGQPRPAAGSSSFTVSFTDGRANVDFGCNTGSGAYRIDGENLVVEHLATTKMACDGELGDQDTFMNELFTGSPAVQLDGDQLTLTSTRIVFTAPKA